MKRRAHVKIGQTINLPIKTFLKMKVGQSDRCNVKMLVILKCNDILTSNNRQA